ncbi:unnamed protein product [Allacma fusca]|uniref:Uncharacterized protein n=1 Tax=Allacma fusca TaxID=39272 RepID=A0A8J2K5Y8_9HEXA|nr:unnamed protein product [Allacma fusca]
MKINQKPVIGEQPNPQLFIGPALAHIFGPTNILGRRRNVGPNYYPNLIPIVAQHWADAIQYHTHRLTLQGGKV